MLFHSLPYPFRHDVARLLAHVNLPYRLLDAVDRAELIGSIDCGTHSTALSPASQRQIADALDRVADKARGMAERLRSAADKGGV